MVEKIRWNENGPRVTGIRPFVCDTKRSAREAEQVPLVEKGPYVKLTCLCDDCHCTYWFKEYISGK